MFMFVLARPPVGPAAAGVHVRPGRLQREPSRALGSWLRIREPRTLFLQTYRGVTVVVNVCWLFWRNLTCNVLYSQLKFPAQTVLGVSSK